MVHVRYGRAASVLSGLCSHALFDIVLRLCGCAALHVPRTVQLCAVCVLPYEVPHVCTVSVQLLAPLLMEVFSTISWEDGSGKHFWAFTDYARTGFEYSDPS